MKKLSYYNKSYTEKYKTTKSSLGLTIVAIIISYWKFNFGIATIISIALITIREIQLHYLKRK